MEISNAALYGKGVFTTISIQDCNPFLWKKHWKRLSDNSTKVAIDLSDFSENMIEEFLDEAIRENKVIDGRARITFSDKSESKIWARGNSQKTSLSIITGGLRPIADNFKLTVSPYPVNSHSPLAGVKSCNYLENIIALDEAKARAFDEAVRVNDRGTITSAAMANVFWLKDDQLHTPSLKTGCLAGTTREYVLENIDCREVEAGMDELDQADAIYLTSAGIGIIEVADFNGRNRLSRSHPINALWPIARNAG
ncbi:MAG: aminotransferase class IV [Pyrinomonadaceae bacterium]